MIRCLRRSNRNFQAIQKLQKWQNNQLPTQINAAMQAKEIFICIRNNKSLALKNRL
jgi:hypothetical protein